MAMVRSDPFASIGELTGAINRRWPLQEATWLRVFQILRRGRLLSRKARFRLARGMYQ